MVKETTDISLVLLPCWGITDPPLALASLASFLREKNISVDVHDYNILLYHLLSDYRNWWNIAFGVNKWEEESFVNKFYDDNTFLLEVLMHDMMKRSPVYVGFTVFMSNRLLVERFSRELKKKYPDVKIIFGGPEITQMNDLTRYSRENAHVRYFVKGEAEESLYNIIQGTENRAILQSDIIKSLDKLPVTDFSDYDFRAYADTTAFPTFSSRGCINRCIYCTERLNMQVFRFRSAVKTYNDIVAQKKEYPYMKMFRLHESTSNGNVKELEKFADLMITGKLRLKWAINAACMRKEMDLSLLKKLKKAGCTFIAYGLETPVHRILDSVGKTVSKDADFDKIVRESHQAGLQVGLDIMFGLPGETREDFKLQLDFLKRNHKYIHDIVPSLWFCYFPSGSEGFKHPEKYGIDLELGSLYWKDTVTGKDYITRMFRFYRYVSLMKNYGIACIFGYKTMPSPNTLALAYCEKMHETGKDVPKNIDNIIHLSNVLHGIPAVVKRTRSILHDFVETAVNKVVMLILNRTKYMNKVESYYQRFFNHLLKHDIYPSTSKWLGVFFNAWQYKLESILIDLDITNSRASFTQKTCYALLSRFSPKTVHEIRHKLYRIGALEVMIRDMIKRRFFYFFHGQPWDKKFEW